MNSNPADTPRLKPETRSGRMRLISFLRLQANHQATISVIAGNILIIVVFSLFEPRFISARNFVNLVLQMSGVFVTAIGVVFVLLIAEIDLSIAYVGAIGSVTMTLLLREGVSEWPAWLALPVALMLTTLIGFMQGYIITKAKAPSFVVTLAGLLIWSGIVLILTTQFSTTGTLVIQDPIVLGIANSYLSALWSWIAFFLSLTIFTMSLVVKRRTRMQQGLAASSISILVIRALVVGLVGGLTVWYANRDRGVPVVAVLSLLMLVMWSFIASRTRFGRYVYAVGSNPEAARRAGIDVDRVRILVFMISGFMAGAGGIILASRLRSVDTNTGGGNLLLNAVAAAIIGGTSLFGGHGKVSDALFGALIIASVENGMGLLGLPSGVRIFVNGIVLLIAVLGDSLSRSTRNNRDLIS